MYPPPPPPPPQPPSWAGMERPNSSYDTFFEAAASDRGWRWWMILGWIVGAFGILIYVILNL